MRELVLVVCALAACGGGDELLIIDAAPPIDLQCESCNPISHSGCFSDQRCSYIHDDAGGTFGACGHASPTCVPEGSLAPGASCTISAGLPDDCSAGTFCVHGTCRQVCLSGSPATACTSGACWFSEQLLGVTYGTCAPPCDPLANECPAGEGCYLLHPSGEGGCVVAGEVLEGNACQKAEDCVAGTMCGQHVCRRICDPTLGDCPSPQTCEPWTESGSAGLCW